MHRYLHERYISICCIDSLQVYRETLLYGNWKIKLGYLKFAHGSTEWPPYLLDLIPFDYFVWDHIKYHCYANNPRKKKELIANLKKVVGSFTTDILGSDYFSFREKMHIVIILIVRTLKIFTSKNPNFVYLKKIFCNFIPMIEKSYH